MNRPFFYTDFSNVELAMMANLRAFGSVQYNNAGAPTRPSVQPKPQPTPQPAKHNRVEVVYIAGCFREARNIKRWLDVDAGKLYPDATSKYCVNSGFVAAGAQFSYPIYSNKVGDKVRFMQIPESTTVKAVDVQFKEEKTVTTWRVGTTEFISEYVAINHAKHMAAINPGKEFIVDKVTTTKVVTKSKPYKVTETAQVTTVQTKSWE